MTTADKTITTIVVINITTFISYTTIPNATGKATTVALTTEEEEHTPSIRVAVFFTVSTNITTTAIA